MKLDLLYFSDIQISGLGSLLPYFMIKDEQEKDSNMLKSLLLLQMMSPTKNLIGTDSVLPLMLMMNKGKLYKKSKHIALNFKHK